MAKDVNNVHQRMSVVHVVTEGASSGTLPRKEKRKKKKRTRRRKEKKYEENTDDDNDVRVKLY